MHTEDCHSSGEQLRINLFFLKDRISMEFYILIMANLVLRVLM